MPKFSVSKSIYINADPQTVYERVADFRTWPDWSPWLCSEPEAEIKVSDPSNEVGAVYSWSGEVVGAGELEHLSLDPGRKIRDEIRFLRPMKSVSNVGFDFEPNGDGTKVTWSMSGSLPFFLFWMVGQIEVFVGMDYERGLRMLKEWIETGRVNSKTTIVGNQPMGPFTVLGVRREASLAEIGASMDAAMRSAEELLSKAGMPTDGERVSAYHVFDMKNQRVEYTTGFLFGQPPASLPDGLASWHLPETQTFRVDHTGSYDHLGNAWSAAQQHVRCKKKKMDKKTAAFELYKNLPHDTDAEHLLTEIYIPLK